ncbi:MAG: AAA family ATPase [Acidobacteriota bacterium]|jgi:predicted ATPase
MNAYLKILTHPVFMNLNFHMPMIVDLSHPLIMLTGENGSGKSTLLHSIYYAVKGEQVPHYSYRLDLGGAKTPHVFLFDAEQHNPRNQLELFENDAQTKEFLQMASHGQVMLTMFRDAFPSLPDGTVLLLDEPEMALSQSNQRRTLKMLKELVDQKQMRIVAATHSPVLLDAAETYVINLDDYVNRNIIPTDMPAPGESQIQ